MKAFCLDNQSIPVNPQTRNPQIKVRQLRYSGRSSVDQGIPLLRIKTLLESSPLRSRILVGTWAVCFRYTVFSSIDIQLTVSGYSVTTQDFKVDYRSAACMGHGPCTKNFRTRAARDERAPPRGKRPVRRMRGGGCVMLL